MNLSEPQFEGWLSAYGRAWEKKDGEAFGALFEENGIYYWTPFDDPKKGIPEIIKAFEDAVANQDDIEFGARVLYVEARLGAAHWSCFFTRKATGKRVHLDGIFVVQFGDNGKALSFKEWWHSDE
ncbi:MAG: nuclear transport factor 2 family protein [Pseudomonadota bacterium]